MVAVAVLVALLITSSCSGTEDSSVESSPLDTTVSEGTLASPPGSTATTDSIPPAETVDADTGAAMVPGDPAALEDAGVQVVESIGDLTAVEAPMVLTRVQAERLLADVGPQSGPLGIEIDGLVPLPPDVPAMSYLLAAWISTFETAGAETARTWMGSNDWSRAPQIRFPDAVIALFVNDFAAAVDAAGSPDDQSLQFDLSALLPPGSDDVGAVGEPNGFAHGFIGASWAAPQALAGPCTAVQNFVSVALASVVNALRINPAAGGGAFAEVTNFFVNLYNAAVALAGGLAQEAIDQVIGPVFDVIRSGIATLAIATQIASFFTDTSLTVDLSPPRKQTRFAVGAEADITGEFVARANSLTGKWPGPLVECADATKVKLPTPIGVGADATWTVTQAQPVISARSSTTKVGSDLMARLGFTTGREEDDSGEEANILAYANVEIERRDIEQLLQLGRTEVQSAKMILLRRVPPVLRDVADRALSAVLDPVLTQLQKEIQKAATGFFTLSGMNFVDVSFHRPPEPTTTPATTAPPTTDPELDFCTQYRAMLDNALATAGTDIPVWAGEIARRLERMRPAAPADLVGDVDVMTAAYRANADDADIGTIIELSQPLPQAVERISSFCGVDPLL